MCQGSIPLGEVEGPHCDVSQVAVASERPATISEIASAGGNQNNSARPNVFTLTLNTAKERKNGHQNSTHKRSFYVLTI